MTALRTVPAEQFIAGRYRLLDLIGEGGMGSVYRAEDRLHGRLVALKRVNLMTDDDPAPAVAPQPADGKAESPSHGLRLALAQEFKFLASLRHPNIVSVLDYGFDQSRRPYFVMELLPAPKTITEAGTFAEQRVRVAYLAQMLQALAYLHRRGILHRDLKPDNVLVSENRVRLLDFGLSANAAEIKPNDFLSGTYQYLAPEVLDGQRPSYQSDLFAVGVIAYEMFSGNYPFYAENLSAMLTHIVETDPDYSELDVPSGFSTIIQRLLQKRPQARYESAQAALLALHRAAPAVLEVESQTIRESYLQASRFVGRDAELDHLLRALRGAMDGNGAIWLVGGESGIGKTRLLDEFRARALVEGALVVSGRATRDGGVFQLWRDLVARLSLTAPLSATTLATLQVINPSLSAITKQPAAPLGDATPALESRLQEAIVELFRQQAQPVVVLLEDLHWAKSDMGILRRLALIVRELRLLIVGTFRTDERPALPDELPDAGLLRLSRLTANDTSALIGSMVANPTSDLITFLSRETEGNVYFLVEAVRALAEEAGSLDGITVHRLPTHIFTGGVEQFIERRISRVSAATSSLLRYAAAFGRVIDLAAMRQVAAEVNLDTWLIACSEAAVCEVQNEQWQFTHEKLRESILNRLSADERRLLYQQTAQALIAVYDADDASAVRIAAHCALAGEVQQDFQYSLRAARYFLKVNRFGDAQASAAHALAILSTLSEDRATYLEVISTLALAHWFSAEYALAEPLLRESITLATAVGHTTLRIDLLLHLGELLRRQGQADAGREALTTAHQLAVESGDQGRVAAALLRQVSPILDLEWGVVRETARRALAIYEAVGDEFGQANAMHRIALTLAEPQEQEEATALLQRARDIFKAQHQRNAYLDVQRHLCAQALGDGNLQQAQEIAYESLQAAREIGNKRQVAAILQIAGQVATRQQAWEQAESYSRESAAIFRTLNDVAYLTYSLTSLGSVLRERGVLEDALATLDEAHSVAQRLMVSELLIAVYLHRAKVLIDLNRLSLAREDIKVAVAFARAEGTTQDKLYLAEVCLYLCLKTNDWGKAATIAACLANVHTGDTFTQEAAQTALRRLADVLPATTIATLSATGRTLLLDDAFTLVNTVS
jgi:tetratricopeptide (TPR) repeat protein